MEPDSEQAPSEKMLISFVFSSIVFFISEIFVMELIRSNEFNKRRYMDTWFSVEFTGTDSKLSPHATEGSSQTSPMF